MKDHAGHEMDASDFGDVRTNIGVCPNCGRFDWVLVANRSADITVDNDKGLLWACPCGEFKWTSYAEWEKGQSLARGLADRKAGRMHPLSEVSQDKP